MIYRKFEDLVTLNNAIGPSYQAHHYLSGSGMHSRIALYKGSQFVDEFGAVSFMLDILRLLTSVEWMEEHGLYREK
jgi:hypothetical protein